MRTTITRQFVALVLLALLAPALQAQLFQQLYSYSTPNYLRTGPFRDIVCMANTGPLGENVITVGSTDITPEAGVLAHHDILGAPITYLEVTNNSSHPVEGSTLCNTPSGNVVSCYFDPTDFATDILFTSISGTVIWSTRIKDVRIRDVVCAPMSGVPGGEQIWLTGHTQTPNVVLVGLDGLGGMIFGREYFLPASFSRTLGFELDWSAPLNRVTIVGKTNVSNCSDGLLLLRTDAVGAVMMGRVYTDPLCAFNYGGKALVKAPASPNRYAIYFEYEDVTDTNQTYPAMMEIGMGGNPIWTNFYRGTGFFGGLKHDSRGGLATNGNRYMLTGIFRSTYYTTGQFSAFTLTVDLAGTGLNYNEYETASAYPSSGNTFKNLFWHPGQSKYYIAGEYETSGGLAASWPGPSFPNSFWMLRTNGSGRSDCSVQDTAITQAITPQTAAYTAPFEQLDQVTSPLLTQTVTPAMVDQCPAMKQGLGPEPEAESSRPAIAFLEGRDQIRIDIPMDTEGSTESDSYQITVMDLQGHTILAFPASQGRHLIPTDQLARGIYLVRFAAPNQVPGVKKVAVR